MLRLHSKSCRIRRTLWLALASSLSIVASAFGVEAKQQDNRKLEQSEAARVEAGNSKSALNLKQIALAIQNYHEAWGRLPPAIGVKTLTRGPRPGAENAKAQPCSWRVRILPFVGGGNIYNDYRFEETWDSDHNKKFLTAMPAVFRHPLDDPNSTNTSYFVLKGSGTPFSDDKGMRFSEIVDGMSATVMVVEAKRSVPWTKPEDIDYDPEKPIPQLGGWFDEGFNAALCDGSARFIKKSTPDELLRALFSRAGREQIDLEKLGN